MMKTMYLKEMVRSFLYLTVITLFLITMSSCQSKEAKAEKLISEQIKKSENVESFEPISTTVQDAKQTPFNDSITWNLALKMVWETQSHIEMAQEFLNENDAEMLIDGLDIVYKSRMNKLIDSINCRISELDTSKIIGYEIYQYATGKLKNGGRHELHLRVVANSAIDKILIFEETTSSDSKACKDMINAAIEHKLEKYWIDPEKEKFLRLTGIDLN